MRFLFYIVAFVLFIPLQTFVFHWVSIFGIKPDLSLWMVYLTGFIEGVWKGGMMGFFYGLVLDSFSPGKKGMNTFIKTLLGFFSGVMGRALVETKAFFHFGMLFLFSLTQGILVYWILYLSGEFLPLGGTMGKVVFPQALYDGIVGGAIINLILVTPLFRKRLQEGRR